MQLKTNLKIGFSLFEEISESRYGSRKHYFLSLYEGINQSRTYEKLKSLNLEFKYNAEKQIQNLTVLLPKEKKQTTDLRKTNINNIFKPTTIYFIDEFLREECNPNREHGSIEEEKDLFEISFHQNTKWRVLNLTIINLFVIGRLVKIILC